ncbi:MAG: DNA-processing protein DprA [Oscillospiraceae bacterium]|jgi:DNA processing protein|nr:DNA-processing protein DprA [Oscillospiraceae bacterium]
MASLKYWVWLADCVGASAASRLLERFGEPEQIYFAQDSEYRGVPDLSQRDLKNLADKRLSSANLVLASCTEHGYRILTIQDAEYPVRLRNIPDPPVVLYIRGRLPVMDEEAAIAVVGTRDCTPYGISLAEKTCYELARRGLVVVTGLARGVDSAAAKGALRGGGVVVGVLGCGLDVVYPAENGALFDDVAATGAIISEYAPSTPVNGSNFPVRNRIMSGISVGVAVIEAPLRSGALITANRALEQGRDVFALPGNVGVATSEGTNKLIQDGAYPFMSADDIAREYVALFPDKIRGMNARGVPLDPKLAKRMVEAMTENRSHDAIVRAPAKKEIDNEQSLEYIDVNNLDKPSPDVNLILEQVEPEEQPIIRAIDQIGRGNSAHIDEIIEQCGIPASDALAALTMLEISGYVTQTDGKYFSLSMPEQ